MSLGCLPTVPNCCFSIPLKIGCIIICILSIIFGCMDMGLKTFSKDAPDPDNPLESASCKYYFVNEGFRTTVETVDWIKSVCGIAVFVTAIIFLVGIYGQLPITAIMFAIAALAWGIFKLISVILNLVGIFAMDAAGVCPNDEAAYREIGHVILGLLMIYFAIVANSYSDEM